MMNIVLVTLLILITLSHISGWRPFTVEFKNISYQILDPALIDGNVTIKNKTFDMYVSILKDISRPYIDFQLLHDSGNGKFDMVHSNKTVDICMFLKNRKSNPVFNIGYNLASGYVDMPRNCPLIQKRYAIVNFTIDPEKFPPFMPDLKAHASGELWIKENGKKKIVLKSSLNVIIERSYKSNGKH